jgi:hypothetical protein
MAEEDTTQHPAVESVACSSNNGDYSGAYIPSLERHD